MNMKAFINHLIIRHISLSTTVQNQVEELLITDRYDSTLIGIVLPESAGQILQSIAPNQFKVSITFHLDQQSIIFDYFT